MYTRSQCADSIRHEIRIIRHLARQVPEGTLDWRPTPGQRSTLELLRYLTTCALVPASMVRDGNWDAAEGLEMEAEAVESGGFDAAMARQEERLLAILDGFSDEELATRPTTMPWGTPCVTGEGLVNMCLKTLVAYRMQLFLYAKQAGNADLGPADCWVGVSRPKG